VARGRRRGGSRGRGARARDEGGLVARGERDDGRRAVGKMKKDGRVPPAGGPPGGVGDEARASGDGATARSGGRGVSVARRGARGGSRARAATFASARRVARRAGKWREKSNAFRRGGWGGARTSPSRPRPRGRCRWPGVPPWRRTRSSRRRTCRPTRARATSRDSFRALFQVGHRALRGPIPRTCRRVSGVARRSRAATFARRGFRRATRPERGEDGFARRVVRRDARRRDGSARRRSRRGSLGTCRQSVLGPTRIASRATRLNAHTRPSGGPHHENLPAKPRPGSAWETLRTRVSRPGVDAFYPEFGESRV
jgi:hypothetical protein